MSSPDDPLCPAVGWGGYRATVAAILGLALLLRAVYALWYLPATAVFSDEDHYLGIIANLLEHGTHVSSLGTYAFSMPFTPVLMALAGKVFGPGLVTYRVVGVLLSTATVWLVALVARRTAPHLPLAPVLAAAMAAVYPFFVFYSGLVLTETPFLFLVMAFIVLMMGRDNLSMAILAGVTGGLMHLCRPVGVYFVPLAALWAWRCRGWSPGRALLVVLVAAVVIAPWPLRNARVLGAAVLGTTTAGHVLWEGNNPWNDEGGVSMPHWGKRLFEGMPHWEGPDAELKQDLWKKSQARKYILENPGRFLKVSWNRFQRFWHLWPNASPYDRGSYRWLSLLSFGPVLVLALLCPFVSAESRKRQLLGWLWSALLTLGSIVTVGSLRYRLPLEPVLVAFAGVSLDALRRFVPGLRRRDI